MAAAVTPRSAALAKSGRTMISGRTSEALELTLPMPFRPRSSRSTFCAAAISATGSSERSTSCILTPVSGGPTVKRAPGMVSSFWRSWVSRSAIDSLRSVRCTVVRVSTARRASAAAPGAKASPLEPPPIELKTPSMPGVRMAASRARAATACVSPRVEPGGSSRLICVCARSAAGTKPVGSSGTSAMAPTKNRAAAMAVMPRWFRHQRMTVR
ncbi:hypothetical protein D3C72_1388550 [compost metagenome]